MQAEQTAAISGNGDAMTTQAKETAYQISTKLTNTEFIPEYNDINSAASQSFAQNFTKAVSG